MTTHNQHVAQYLYRKGDQCNMAGYDENAMHFWGLAQIEENHDEIMGMYQEALMNGTLDAPYEDDSEPCQCDQCKYEQDIPF